MIYHVFTAESINVIAKIVRSIASLKLTDFSEVLHDEVETHRPYEVGTKHL
jgi:hypothetical protein